MSKEQREMMNSDDKNVKSSGNPLTWLFRQVLAIEELRVDSSSWNARLTRFLKSPWSRIPKNAKDIGQERNNFNRAISKNHITFRTFQKAIQILGPVRYSMSIRLELRGGRVVEVTTPMFPNDFANMDSLQTTFKEHGPEVADSDITDYNQDEENEEVIGTSEDFDEAMEDIPESAPQYVPQTTVRSPIPVLSYEPSLPEPQITAWHLEPVKD